MEENDSNDIVERVVASAARHSDKISKITLRGGVVGKTIMLLMVSALAFAAISWSVKSVAVSLVSLILLFVLVLILGWKALSFAENNPHAALLEGAEFLQHEQLQQLGMKSAPQIKDNPADYTAAKEIASDPSLLPDLEGEEHV